MQMKLSQIAMIPILIQSTLETVTQAVETASIAPAVEQIGISSEMPVMNNVEDTTIFDAPVNDITPESISQAVIETNTVETCVTVDHPIQLDFGCDEIVFSPPPSPERDIEPEAVTEQQLKMREMDRSWPWKDEEKKNHKLVEIHDQCMYVSSETSIKSLSYHHI